MSWTLRQFIDAFQKCTSHGWLDWEEALLLVSWAEQTSGPIVEIGSYMGRSAMLLAQLPEPYAECQGYGKYREIHCVDPWDDHFHSELSGDEIFKRFNANISELCSRDSGIDVTSHRCKVEDWTPIKAGLVYCDGDHSFLGTKFQLRKALTCEPAIIVVHDVNDSGEGKEVKRASLEMLGPWQERLGKMAVWVVNRRNGLVEL